MRGNPIQGWKVHLKEQRLGREGCSWFCIICSTKMSQVGGEKLDLVLPSPSILPTASSAGENGWQQGVMAGTHKMGLREPSKAAGLS